MPELCLKRGNNNMKYSDSWLGKIRVSSNFHQEYTWDYICKRYGFDEDSIKKHHKAVILDEGVWMEISRIFNDGWYFEKVRCITEHNVYFDGSDSTGSLAMGSLDHIFKIDGHVLDIRYLPEDTEKTKQELLLDFINTYAGVLDNRYPPVPKGILKI